MPEEPKKSSAAPSWAVEATSAHRAPLKQPENMTSREKPSERSSSIGFLNLAGYVVGYIALAASSLCLLSSSNGLEKMLRFGVDKHLGAYNPGTMLFDGGAGVILGFIGLVLIRRYLANGAVRFAISSIVVVLVLRAGFIYVSYMTHSVPPTTQVRTGAEVGEQSTSPEPEAPTVKPVTDHLVKGNLSFARGEFLSAIDSFDEAIKAYPDSAEAYNNRGVCHLKLEQCDATVADCTQAVTLDQTYAEAYKNRALAKVGLQQYQSAVDDYTEAIRLKPDYAKAFNYRGLARFRLSDVSGAIDDYKEALRVDPDYAEAQVNLEAASKAL